MRVDSSLLFTVLTILIGLSGGVAVGLQGPLASLMSQRIGSVEGSFVIHTGGALASLLLLLIGLRSGHLGLVSTLPWYALGAGTLGVVLILSISFTMPRIGIAAGMTLLIAGQLTTGVLADHFGFLVGTVRTLDAQRTAGVGLLFLGTWLIVK